MEEATKYKFKALAWDQFVRPIILLFNLYNIKAALMALIVISFIVEEKIMFWISIIFLSGLFIGEIVNYYKSGEYMKNYRRYKYPDYKRATKALKREAKTYNENNQGENEVTGEKE